VEVLRGPQGTLYGRNTTAGAINFVARKPSNEFDADASVTYGRFNEFDIEGGVTLPINDTLSMRVAGVRNQRDGWQTNINPDAPENQRHLDNVDNWAARALLQWKPTENMTWLLNIHGNGNDTNTPVIHADLGQNGTNQPNIYTGYQENGRWDEVSTNYPFKEILHAHGAALTGTMKFGEYTVTSISGYERTDYFESDDDDGSPYQITPIATRDIMSQYSEELRLAAKQGRFDWVVGAFYYHDNLWQVYDTQAFTDPLFAGEGLAIYLQNLPTQTSHNYAGFGDVRIALADDWTLDLGGRYTREAKHFVGNAFQNLPDFNTGWFQTIGGPGDPNAVRNPSWSAPTGRAALEWKPARDLLTYVSASHGFKSGGVNGLAFNSSVELTPYNPEKVDTYELGAKSSWFNGRLVANGAVFYNKLKDMQALVVDVSNVIPLFFVRNAAGGTSKGGELELRARPDEHWNVSVGVGILRTRFDEFIVPSGPDLSGHEFVAAPKLTLDTMIQYSFPFLGGTLAPHVEASYRSHQWFDPNDRPGIDEQSGYPLFDAGIPWHSPDGKWELSLWGRNLADRHYLLNSIGNGAINYGAAVSYHGPPRSYGLTASYYFK
ncbi:MAG TPA: TonB-dependent receptor, partial [Steroidobacteraceae bacterium]|nr:TonB-dependent receptor [Steroidobacteraceae bacterium]